MIKLIQNTNNSWVVKENYRVNWSYVHESYIDFNFQKVFVKLCIKKEKDR